MDYTELTPLVDSVPNDGTLTAEEIAKLKWIVKNFDKKGNLGEDDKSSSSSSSDDSDYPEFAETTHAWFVFGSKKLDWLIGIMILGFQLYVYSLFAGEAIGDYEAGVVSVSVPHHDCREDGGIIDLENELKCNADKADPLDAFAAFFMLGIFLTSDMIQAFRAVKFSRTHGVLAIIYAVLALIEVISALLSAIVSISQKLYVGEATDAIEVGVGLLFIRELSSKAYEGLRYNKEKKYKSFFSILTLTVFFGFFLHPKLKELLAKY